MESKFFLFWVHLHFHLISSLKCRRQPSWPLLVTSTICCLLCCIESISWETECLSECLMLDLQTPTLLTLFHDHGSVKKERSLWSPVTGLKSRAHWLFSSVWITEPLQVDFLMYLAHGKHWSEVKWSESRSVVSDSLQPPGLYSPWDSLGQNTRVGSLSFLQGIFPTQGLNPGLPHFRLLFYQLSQQGSPRILEWVAYPFSRGSSQPRNWTVVSCIAGRFFTNWAIREAPDI